MARQRGIIPIEGTVGNITFYKTRDGYLVKEKTAITADRIAKDASFQRTRENNQEFARAGKAAKLLRTAMRTAIIGGADSRVTSRLVKVMMAAIKLDQTSTRGQRNVIDGEAAVLEGFDFNYNGKLSSTLLMPYTASIDRSIGALDVAIPAYIPAEMIAFPAGATHYKLKTAGVSVDFRNNVFDLATHGTGTLPLQNVAAGPFVLSCGVTTNSTHPLILAFGVEFFQEVNNVLYPLKNGLYNAFAVVKVDA